MSISVKVKIDRVRAILSGRAVEGQHTVQLTDEHLATLDMDERQMLASYDTWHLIDVTPEALLAMVREMLTKKRADVAAETARKQQREDEVVAMCLADHSKLIRTELTRWLSDEYLPKASLADVPWHRPELAVFRVTAKSECETRNEHVKAAFEERQRQAEADALVKAQAVAEFKLQLKTMVETYGTDLQRARLAEGFMGEDEALQLVRDKVFEGFGDFALYTKIKKSDVDHSEHCYDPDKVDFNVWDADELTDAEFKELNVLKAVAKETPRQGAQVFELQPRLHEAECSKCSGSCRRKSVLVSTTWHGRALSREFALED